MSKSNNLQAKRDEEFKEAMDRILRDVKANENTMKKPEEHNIKQTLVAFEKMAGFFENNFIGEYLSLILTVVKRSIFCN